MATGSLYRRVLGEQFAALPVALQQFHDQAEGGSAHGEFHVRRGHGRLRNWLVSLAGLPPAGANVPVTLKVVVEGDRERWIRSFGSVRMETVQWLQDSLLIEAAGPMRFGMELNADATGLRFTSRRAWLWFLRLPVFLMPKISAAVRVRDHGAWHVTVSMTGPLGGLLLAYEGVLQIR